MGDMQLAPLSLAESSDTGLKHCFPVFCYLVGYFMLFY